jgi:acyl carrier protein
MPADPALYDRMQRLVAEILEIEPAQIQGSSRLREDLGMDSLGSLELLSSISEELGIHLEIDEAMGIVTFDDACAFVERARQAPNAATETRELAS